MIASTRDFVMVLIGVGTYGTCHVAWHFWLGKLFQKGVADAKAEVKSAAEKL